MSRWYFALFGLFIGYITIGNALDCYVCTKQAGNVAKCLKSLATCEQNETVCMTEVRWGSAPYWTSGGQKQYYVSKRCAQKDECELTKRKNMKYCTLLWYQDWKCYDCCVGDRCNYFVFSNANQHGTSFLMLLVAVVAPMLGAWAIQ